MGKRGPQAGDIAGKILVDVPIQKPGKKLYYIPKYVTAANASKYRLHVANNQEQVQPTSPAKKIDPDSMRAQRGKNPDKEVLPPNDINRSHSHIGGIKYHPVSERHDDENSDIEHRNERDNYEEMYYGKTKQLTRQEQLGIKLDDVVKLNLKSVNDTVMARKYIQSKLGKFYIFEYANYHYLVSPENKLKEHFMDKLDAITYMERYVDYRLKGEQKSLILKEIDTLTCNMPDELINTFASYSSGNNKVRMEYDGVNTYSVLVNDSPVYQSGDFSTAMSEYYKHIGEIVKIQESDPDIALNVFGSQVVRTNRNAIEKLSMMGKSLEVEILKNFDYSYLKMDDVIVQKNVPASNAICQMPVQEELGHGANELDVKPRRLDYKSRIKLDDNTVLLKEVKKVDEDSAKRVGAAIGIDWDKINFNQFLQGINTEMEHGSKDPQTDVIGDDIVSAGKIALAHLKEVPDYYTRLQLVEKELKDLGLRPKPEEALQDRQRPIERPFIAGKTFQQKNTPKEEAPIVQKDFPKQVECDVHESVGLENKDRIGRKPRPIIGKSFSPMMASVRIGEKQKPISGNEGIGNFSTEVQTTAEENNQMKELSDRGEVKHQGKPFYDMIKSESIYTQIDDILFKSAGLIEGQQPTGVKKLGNEVESNLYYSLRDIINSWYSNVNETTSLDNAVIDLKSSLLKWQINSSKNVVEDIKDIFNKGIEAGVRNTGIPVSDRLKGVFDYQMYKPSGISPALENFQNDVFTNITNILKKHYTQKGFPLYRTQRDIQSYLRKSRYKTRLMLKSEVAGMANLGQLIAWNQDPDKYKYEYFWNAIDDDKIKPISKMRAEGNPYSLKEITYLWENQMQMINNTWYNDQFNQRCSISKGNMINKEWQDNRFSDKTNLFKSTMI